MAWEKSLLCEYDIAADSLNTIVDENKLDELVDKIIANPNIDNVYHMWNHCFCDLLKRVHKKDKHLSLKLARKYYESIRDDITGLYDNDPEQDRIDSIENDLQKFRKYCRDVFTVLSLMDVFYEMMQNFDTNVAKDIKACINYGLMPTMQEKANSGPKYHPWTIAYE